MTQIVKFIYDFTGVNGVQLFAYGFLAGALMIFSGTLLVILYNLTLRSN